MNLIRRYLTAPSTNTEKLVRDFIVLMVGTGLAFLADNATGIATAVNDATGDRIPAVLVAAGLSGVLWLYRLWRGSRWGGNAPTPPAA